MTLKRTQITKYTASDGKEFVGSATKSAAIEYEASLTRNKKRFKVDQDILKIIKDIVPTSLLKQEVPDEQTYGLTYPQDFSSLMEELFYTPICPGDAEEFVEMAEVIQTVVDNFGGIEIIKQIYEYAKKNKI